MRVVVTNLYSDQPKLYEGSASVIEAQILFDYPFLRSGNPEHSNDLMSTLEHLEANQAFSVDVEHDEMQKSAHPDFDASISSSEIVRDMMGFEPQALACFQAARFLAGGMAVSDEKARQALWHADGDIRHAALTAYGFEVTDANLGALDATEKVLSLSLKKSEPQAPTSIESAVPEGQDVVEEIKRAYRDSFVFEVQLAGKHSKGSLVARDEVTGHTWLLKPGSGGAGPAAGESQDTSTQSARETAFYHVVKEWGIWENYPRAELILMDGRQFAALKLLPWVFKTAEKRRVSDPGIARRVLQSFLTSGDLHRWAIADFVLGNVDSHGQNCMFDDEGHVMLIDHGSAFAGSEFDPAHDKNSFVPYYLRAWAPDAFNGLPLEDKLRYLPRVSAPVAENLHQWVAGLHAEVLGAILHRFGINPQATLDRLAKLRTASTGTPVDLAINRLWVTT